MRASDAGPQSVDRALDILDAVAHASGPVTAKALARQLGCALSTVYNLLGPLTARGHVTRTAGGYVLGPQVPALHRAFQRQLSIGEDTRELLARVRRAAGADAYLSTCCDGRIAVVDSTTAVAESTDPFAVGRDLRAHATAHGKALLASVPSAMRRRYLDAHGLPRLSKRTITSPERFESELARVRRRGIAVSFGEYDLDLACVAVPLPGSHPHGTARALSVSLPAAEFQRRHRRIIGVLTRAAGQL